MKLPRSLSRPDRSRRVRHRRQAEQRRSILRHLRLEGLEERRVLTVNVFLDPVTLNATVQDAVDANRLEGLDQIEEANDTTLSESPDTAGFLRVTDPGGVLAGPGAIQISPTEADIAATPEVDVDLQDDDDNLTFASDFDDVDDVETVNVIGGSPATGSDVLRLDASAGVAEMVVIDPDNDNSRAQDISGYAGVSMNVRGYEVIKYLGGGEDDSLEVELDQGVGTARVENAGTVDTDVVRSNVLPDIEWEALEQFVLEGSNEQSQATWVTNQLEGAASYLYRGNNADTLIIEGTRSAGDSISVSLDGSGNVQVVDNQFGTTVHTEDLGLNDRLQLNTLGGDDEVTIDVDGTDLIHDTLIGYDGGTGSDALRVEGDPLFEVTSVTYSPGPAVGEGRLVYDDGAPPPRTPMTVDFANLEPVVDLVPAASLIVNGTDADNAINYAPSELAPTWGKVSVDGFEPIHFENKTDLILNGLAGSDRINLNGPVPAPAGLDSIDVNGGDPTAGSDTVVVNGTTEEDAIEVTPTAIDSAEITGAQDVTMVNVATTEDLVINGQGDANELTVVGFPNQPSRFVHTPGAQVHAGRVDLLDESDIFADAVISALPVRYVNVAGAVRVDGNGGDGDELMALGTLGQDTVSVLGPTETVILNSPLGFHTQLLPVDIDEVEIDLLEGDDRALLNLDGLSGQFQFHGGGPGESDVLIVDGHAGLDEDFVVSPGVLFDLIDVNGGASTIRADGMEHIAVFGNPDDTDTLTVEGTNQNDQIRVESNRISGSSQTPVLAAGFSSLTVDVSQDGDDEVIFDLPRLTAADSYNVVADPDDVEQLVVEGTADDDVVTSTATSITLEQGGDSNTVNFTPAQLDVITVRTFAGNDRITLGIAAPETEKVIDAGAGHDIVDMSGSVDAVIFGGDGDDILIGSPAADRIYGGRGDDQIAGLGGDDVLYGEEGDDRLLGGEGFDRLFGGDDSDTIIWNPGDGSDLVEGGSGQDIVQVVGSDDDDDFELSADGTRLHIERQPDDVVIDAAGIEQVDLNQTMTFVALLSGAEEVPPVVTAASGLSLLTFDSTTGLFGIEVFVSGIAPGDLIASHIHVGAAGVNGPIIFPLGAGAAYTDEGGRLRRRIDDATFPAVNIPDLLAGDTYVNVHTTANPGGEIRGQLVPVSGTPGFGGSDSFVVEDLTTTEVTAVNLGLGLEGDDSEDEVTVHGRTVADDLLVTEADGIVNVAGVELDYDVNVGGAVAAEEDRLTILGNDGDDQIKAAAGVEDTIRITLEGNEGDDVLSADAILIGGPGDDFLEGGAGDDEIFGGPGEDTMIGGGGDDEFDGGPDFDTILIEGTSDADVIDVVQTSATELVHTVNGDTQTDTLIAGTVERALVEAGDGSDTMRVAVDDDLFNDPGLSLRMTVHGGDDQTSDRLGIVDDGEDDLTIYRKAADASAGTAEIGPENDEPFEHVFEGVETVQFVDEDGERINAHDGSGPRLVVFKHDPFELNDDRFLATHLGVGQSLNVDPKIDPGLDPEFALPADEDWYRVEAGTTGTLDFQVFFEEIGELDSGRPGLPGDGNLDIEVYDVDGSPVAGAGPNFGTNDGPDELDVDGDDFDEDERIRIPAVQGQTYYLRVFGVDDAVNGYNVTVLNEAAPKPFDLELDDFPVNPAPNPPGQDDNSDTGRSQFDNVTFDDTPTIFLRLDDGFFLHDLPGNPTDDTPPDEVIPIPFQAGPNQPTEAGYAIAVFDEGATDQAANPVQEPLGFATATAQEGVYEFTVPAGLALSEGSHFLSARVQMIDPADPTAQTGFGPRSKSLEIVVDTTEPPVSLGQPGNPEDGLRPESDTGVSPPNPDTIIDRVTSDTTPTFWGRAEANAIVRMYADVNGNGTLDLGTDVFIGQDTAIPIDGTNQEPDGYWEITSAVDLNDESFFPVADGTRTIFVTAEDLAGNVNAPVGAADELDIFVDTFGPVVESVHISDEPDYDLFDPKPVADGPTPRVDSLTITFSDLPERVAAFLYDALKQDVAESPGNYRVVGDHSGVIFIEDVIVTNVAPAAGAPAEATVELVFAEPLPDDRFTLTVFDSVTDPVGNPLDGDLKATEPGTTGDLFPSGDRVRGGDFAARFTVDSRPEIATWGQGNVWVDINGNMVFDPEGQDNDATNRDFIFKFGLASDAIFAGNFAPAGAAAASGFDKLGAYGFADGSYRFLLDTDDDGVADTTSVMPAAHQVNGIPVAGDFAPGHPGDEIGLFDGRAWYLDTDGDNLISAAERFPSDLRGLPVVGDFNGDGFDDLATFNNDTGRFFFDTDRDGDVDDRLTFNVTGFGDIPVAGDLNLDGIDDIGLWAPGREGQVDSQASEFHFLVSDGPAAALPRDNFDPFSPAPLGNDLYAQFGDDFAVPVFGNFDPPVTANSGDGSGGDPATDPGTLLDVNEDGQVTALDALLVINQLHRQGAEGEQEESSTSLAQPIAAALRGDTSGDGRITALDALLVINHLHRQSAGESDSVAAATTAESWAERVDVVLSAGEEDEDDAEGEEVLLEQLVADQLR